MIYVLWVLLDFVLQIFVYDICNTVEAIWLKQKTYDNSLEFDR